MRGLPLRVQRWLLEESDNPVALANMASDMMAWDGADEDEVIIELRKRMRDNHIRKVTEAFQQLEKKHGRE
jgi:hypothetical protein